MECKRNKWDCKKGRGGGCFQRRKFRVACFDETKLKGNREVSWWGINGIIAGVQEMERVKEGVAVLLKDMWHSAAVNFGCFRG